MYCTSWKNKYNCDSPFCAFQEIFRRKEISQNWCSDISRKNVSKSVSSSIILHLPSLVTIVKVVFCFFFAMVFMFKSPPQLDIYVSFPRPGPSDSGVVLPALTQSLSSTIAERQRRTRAVQRDRLKRTVQWQDQTTTVLPTSHLRGGACHGCSEKPNEHKLRGFCGTNSQWQYLYNIFKMAVMGTEIWRTAETTRKVYRLWLLHTKDEEKYVSHPALYWD